MYIIKKLFLQYKTHESQRGNRIFILVKTTVSLLGDNQDSTETNDTYLDYVKVWATTTDCVGLTHVFNETFRFFKALDMIVYKLLLEQTPRERVQLMKWY